MSWPPQGGLSIDLTRMDQILEVNVSDLDCVVQPGVTRKQLNSYLRDTGLFFPVDPGADATLGGMCATGASGTNAVRYGTMRENVLGLTIVSASGEVVTTGGRVRKSSAGYDLTKLMIGSEGTLGIITEVTLRLYGVPEAVSACVCAFETLEGAVDAVIATIQMGLPVARIELLDDAQIRACNAYSHLDLAEQPTLFLEFHGTEQSVADDVNALAAWRANLVVEISTGRPMRRPQSSLDSAAQCGLCHDTIGAGCAVDDNGCLCADFPIGGMYFSDQGRSGDHDINGHHSRSCGRWKFSCRGGVERRRPRRDGRDGGV